MLQATLFNAVRKAGALQLQQLSAAYRGRYAKLATQAVAQALQRVSSAGDNENGGSEREGQ
jgi:hypothetical protein